MRIKLFILVTPSNFSCSRVANLQLSPIKFQKFCFVLGSCNDFRSLVVRIWTSPFFPYHNFWNNTVFGLEMQYVQSRELMDKRSKDASLIRLGLITFVCNLVLNHFRPTAAMIDIFLTGRPVLKYIQLLWEYQMYCNYPI